MVQYLDSPNKLKWTLPTMPTKCWKPWRKDFGWCWRGRNRMLADTMLVFQALAEGLQGALAATAFGELAQEP